MGRWVSISVSELGKIWTRED